MFPKLFHQIWLGDRPFPAVAESWRRGLTEIHPDWDYRLWGDDDLGDLESRLFCPQLVLNPDIGMGVRCDVLRFELVRLFGGVYLDHDMEAFQPLDELILNDCVHIGLSFNRPEAVSTAIFGSPQGHPFWEFHLRRLRATVPARRPDKPKDVFHLTGYQALSKTIHEWLCGNYQCHELRRPDGFIAGWLFEHGDLVLWSREAVHPYHVGEMHFRDFRKEDFPNAYAVHYWQGEWFGEHAAAMAGRTTGRA